MLHGEKPTDKRSLVVICGPTSVGKTKVAIRIAQYFDTIIISADSRQFYKELKIGTAAPDAGELAAAPHFFTGNLSISDHYNVSKFENEALALLDGQFNHHNPIVMAGGSGLYIDAVIKGIDDFPDASAELREMVKNWHDLHGLDFLREKLKTLDPDYYAAVDLNNPNRIKRAIEVCLATGKPYSSLRRNQPKKRNFNTIKIGLNLPREELFRRIALRTEKMISEGLIQEAESLLPHRHLNALNTLGYKEIFEFLDGKTNLSQAIENIKTGTRRYAKRQLTWLKRDKEIKWFSPENTDEIIRFVELKMQIIHPPP
jgi:tRNA dimethylallyltransferase